MTKGSEDRADGSAQGEDAPAPIRLDIEAMGRRARAMVMHDAIPADIRVLPWVLWRFLPPKTPGAKPRKAPCQRNKEMASSVNPSTWCSFEEARETFNRSKWAHGIGVVLNGAGVVCVDLDKCRDADTGSIEAWASDDVRRFSSWCEVSPSGTGIHIFMRARLSGGWNVSADGRREVYDQGRFIAVTGAPAVVNVPAIGERQVELDVWRQEHAASAPVAKEPPTKAAAKPTPMHSPRGKGGRRTFNEEVVEELRRRNEDCASLASRLGLRGGKGAGANKRRWFCPSCQTDKSKTPDLHTPSRGGWSCFKCNKKGGPFELVGLVMGRDSRGSGFVVVARELARLEGLQDELDAVDDGGQKRRKPEAQKSERPVVREPVLAPGALADVWEALASDATEAAAWLEQRRGIPPRLVESGFATINRGRAESLPWPSYSDGTPFRDHAIRTTSARPCIAAPLRSASTNLVEAMQVRELDGSYRALISKKRDADGSPRGYGWAGAALRADLLVITEGMADTFAVEAALLHDVRAVVVGAIDKGEIVTWARWLAPRASLTTRIVLLRQLDGKTAGGIGGGQVEAQNAHAELVAAGRMAEHFAWPLFARELFARGVDIRPRRAMGLDVADAAADAAHALPDGFGSAFAPALRASLGLVNRDRGDGLQGDP